MVKTSLKSREYHTLEIENQEFPKRIRDTKTKINSIKLDLLIWNFINKFNFTKFFHLFNKMCPSCGRKFSEIFIDYYITKQIACKKCKYKTIFSNFLISFFLNAVGRGLNIPKKKISRDLERKRTLKAINVILYRRNWDVWY